MKHQRIQRIRYGITVLCLTFIVCHILVALAFTFVPGFSLGKSKIAAFYEHFIHLGPFYREESIQSSPHFVVSNGNEHLDLIGVLQRQYEVNPLRMDALLLRNHVRRSADAFAKSNSDSVAFRKLIFVSREVLPASFATDSVSWTYFHSWFDLKSNHLVNDTVFTHKVSNPE